MIIQKRIRRDEETRNTSYTFLWLHYEYTHKIKIHGISRRFFLRWMETTERISEFEIDGIGWAREKEQLFLYQNDNRISGKALLCCRERWKSQPSRNCFELLYAWCFVLWSRAKTKIHNTICFSFVFALLSLRMIWNCAATGCWICVCTGSRHPKRHIYAGINETNDFIWFRVLRNKCWVVLRMCVSLAFTAVSFDSVRISKLFETKGNEPFTLLIYFCIQRRSKCIIRMKIRKIDGTAEHSLTHILNCGQCWNFSLACEFICYGYWIIYDIRHYKMRRTYSNRALESHRISVPNKSSHFPSRQTNISLSSRNRTSQEVFPFAHVQCFFRQSQLSASTHVWCCFSSQKWCYLKLGLCLFFLFSLWGKCPSKCRLLFK